MRELVDGPSTEDLQRAVAPHLGRVYRLPHKIGFWTVYHLPSTVYLSIARAEPLYVICFEVSPPIPTHTDTARRS